VLAERGRHSLNDPSPEQIFCATVALLAYLAFGMAGVVLEYRLHKIFGELPKTFADAEHASPQAQRLFMIYQRWRKAGTPVWLLGAVLLVFVSMA